MNGCICDVLLVDLPGSARGRMMEALTNKIHENICRITYVGLVVKGHERDEGST